MPSPASCCATSRSRSCVPTSGCRGCRASSCWPRCAQQASDAKLVLLTAYADTDVAIAAINEIGLDHYLLKPWDPPDERLYPVIDDLLGDWRRGRPEHTSDVRIIGHRWSERSHEIKTFLVSNHVPYRWFDIERDEEGARLVALADAATADLPLVLVPDGATLRSPTILDLAAASACARRPSGSSTTSASSAGARPVSPLRCMPRRRV